MVIAQTAMTVFGIKSALSSCRSLLYAKGNPSSASAVPADDHILAGFPALVLARRGFFFGHNAGTGSATVFELNKAKFL